MRIYALENNVTGIVHCCGAEHADRLTLAERAIQAFELDRDLLDVAPPPDGALGAEVIPRDTRLSADATAQALGVELPSLDSMLTKLHQEMDETPNGDARSPVEEVRA